MSKIAHKLSYALFVTTSLTMIVLFVWGFILPPMGTIDQSLIQAGGLLLALATIAQLPHIIETIGENRTLKLSKGDFTIETSKNKNI